MGIIKAITGTIGGSLADQWLDVIEPDDMSDSTVFTRGVSFNAKDKRSGNKKATRGIITDGSVIHVYDNQFMLMVDGGKIVDYSAEPGYFKVDNKSAPSLFNGNFKEALAETFNRFKFGGTPSDNLQVFYINLQEIKGIRFGTKNPINYFDNFYQAELFLRAHGTYTIKITDPLKFYVEAVPRNAERIDINDINEQYLNEFLEALQSVINKMSADGERISFVSSKSRELSKYMGETLDEYWKENRGFEIQAVAIASISYDEQSQKLINMRNQGAMLSDASIREGYVQGSMARGIEAAGSNPGGAANAFFGVGMGAKASSGMAGAFSETNREQMNRQTNAQNKWVCSNCANANDENAKFCAECGTANAAAACPQCGYKFQGAAPKFCPECGQKL